MYENTESLCCTPETNIILHANYNSMKKKKKLTMYIVASVATLRGELPRSLSGKESITCQCRRCGFYPWVGKIPWRRRKWQPTPVFLPGKSYGQRNLVGYSPWGHKESAMTERLSRHACMESWESYLLSCLSDWISKLLTPFVTLDLLGKNRKDILKDDPKEECVNPEDYCLKPK